MAVTATETPAKKIKRRASVADLAPTPAPTPDGVTETAKKRKKKHADASLNDAGLEETPVKAEKKAENHRTGHDKEAGDLELLVTRLDDVMTKKEKKKGRRKSEVALVEEGAQGIEAVPAETSPEKKRKRKSEVAAVTGDSQDAIQIQAPKEKKKKKKKTLDTLTAASPPDVEEPVTTNVSAVLASTSEPIPSKKEKKRRKSEVAMEVDVPAPAPASELNNSLAVDPGPSTVQPKKEKKKKHIADATSVAPAESPLEVVTSTIEPVNPAKKEKKRKRKEVDDSMNVDTPAKPAEKSKAGSIVDPSSDEGLSSTGKDALVYAYSHHSNNAAFKFNKAKQSWLVRNMWKLDEISEAYTPLLAQYLGTVQGQMRKSLQNICKDKIDAAEESETIRARAQACQKALAANEPTETAT